MKRVIEPIANVVDFGPYSKTPSGMITPDEFVYGAAAITYKDIGALTEVVELREEDKDIHKKVVKSLIKSAGGGHASMATTPGLWVFLEGNCSKLVDSLFTGARFGSSLMPSGRRIPITKEQIVVPKGIHGGDGAAEELYVGAIERQIDVYEQLQKMEVPKEEASKIVSYGHRGGGLIFMPLETIIGVSKTFSRASPGDIPLEGIEIMNQLEQFIHANGMEVVYEARRAAPRESCPNPNIFHHRINEAEELAGNRGESPRIISVTDKSTESRNARIREYMKMRAQIFANPDGIESRWKEVSGMLHEIVEDYNTSVSVETFCNTPWRVWGEVKRHRTLPQTTESVYRAAGKALEFLTKHEVHEDIEKVFSLPPSVKNNPENLTLWCETFANSMGAYDKLLNMGIAESDAIALVPRGLKLGVIKNFDLYNLTEGYISLRLCQTAEPEMRRITQKEKGLITSSPDLSADVRGLLAPKCHYTGFCHEADYSKSCKQVKTVVDKYDEDFHNRITNAREQEIRKALE